MFGVVLTELSLVVLSLNVKARPPRRISCPQLELQSIDCQAAIADCRAAILVLRLPGCDCRAAIAGPSWSREFPAHTRHLWTEKISTPPALAGPLSSSRCFILYPFASGHTVSNIPDPIRTRKLIGRRPGQYWGGGPPGKPFGCRWLFRFLL